MTRALIVVLLGCSGSPRAPTPPSPERCGQFVEHLVDLSWDAHPRSASYGDGFAEFRYMYKLELKRDHGPMLTTRCHAAPLAHIACAMAAETLAAAAACDPTFAFDPHAPT